jgi:hypothetical protein
MARLLAFASVIVIAFLAMASLRLDKSRPGQS